MAGLDATPVLKRWGRLRLARLARQDAAAAQQRTLLRLVRKAEDTRFGRAHGFAAIRSVADFQRAVPLRTYEAFWDEWFREPFPVIAGATWPGPIPYFAVSSGTSSGRTKYIPVSRAMIRSNTRAGTDLLLFHLARHPGSRVLGGKNFMLGGSVAMQDLGHGIKAGDLSGIVRAEAPVWSRPFVFPSTADALETDWERKIDKLARASLAEDIRTIAGTPSWLLLFFERLAAIGGRGNRIAAYYPHLSLLAWGGLSVAPYRETFARWLDGSAADTREVYPASEGFIAAEDGAAGEGLRLNLDHGLFFEFVPVDELDALSPTRHWIGNAEIGREYALILSTCAGLWAYRIGDVVRLVSRTPPRLLVTGRTSYYLSAFGEHLSGAEIEAGLLEAARTIGAALGEYAVGPLFPEGERSAGQHLFVMELDPVPDAAAAEEVARTLDAALARQNEDYEVHRRGDYQLLPPAVAAVPPGTFTGWMRARGKLGGQNKVPRVINDPELFRHLRTFVAGRGA